MRSTTLPACLCLLVAPLVTGCQDDPPKNEDTGDVQPCEPTDDVVAGSIVSDTSYLDYECRADFWMPDNCEDKVVGLVVKGTGASPGEVYVLPPQGGGSSGCGNSAYEMTGSGSSGWEASAADYDFCDANEDTEALTCNTVEGAHAQAWKVYFYEPAGGCDDVGDLEATFLMPSEDDCDPPAHTPDDSCAGANDADVHFFHRSAFDRNGDGTVHTHILPIVEDGGDYTERAWLREITVTDWGDATALYVLKSGYRIHYNGDSVVEDSGIVKLTSQDATETFNAGVVHMGTTFATNSFSKSAASWEPPTVTMDWSCEVAAPPTPPHFQVIQGLPQAYAARLSDLNINGVGYDHRIKLRLFTGTGPHARIEFEGRFHDAITLPITASGSNWTFDYVSDAIGIDAEGTISTSGSNKVVDFDRLYLRGHNLGTPTWTLTPFSE